MTKRVIKLILIFILPVLAGLVISISIWLESYQRWKDSLQVVDTGWVVDTQGVPLPVVMIEMTGGHLEVLLDEEVIYDNDPPSAVPGMSGVRTLFVSIPEGADGRVMEIRINVGDRQVNTMTDEALFGTYPDVFRLFLIRRLPALAVGSFMMLFGVVFLMLTITFSISTPGSGRHVLGAVISMVLGVWLLCVQGITPIFIRAPFDVYLEVISSILILPLLLTILYTMRNDRSILEYGIWIFVSCMGLYLIAAAAGHGYNETLRHLASLLPIFACLSYVVAQLLHYYINISASYARQEEYASLNEKAYIDALTGLPNRKSAGNVFRSLNSASGSYCIVSLDLDNLKQINDRFGHAAGDEMLRTTAFVLNDCVGEKGFRARMGGDEFIIVLKKVSREALEDLLQKIVTGLHEAGEHHNKMVYDISYGYAFDGESRDRDAEAVFRIADDRMYEQKNKKKAQRQSG